MPNWVMNRLTVVGPEPSIDAFVVAATRPNGSILLCDTFCPLPAQATVEWVDLQGEKHSAFARVDRDGVDGYAMALDHWGSKWGDCRTSVTDRVHGTVRLEFDTAWSPMHEAMLKISAANPALTFAMSGIEEQPCWCGWMLYANGECVAEGEIDLDGQPDWGPYPSEEIDAWFAGLAGSAEVAAETALTERVS